jgi:manganese transport protein
MSIDPRKGTKHPKDGICMFGLFKKHAPRLGGLEIFKFVGPGFLVAIGFIDPGNWASNLAAGSMFGYSLLWMVTLSTVMLIVLQRSAARLGIVTGLCISEAASKYMRRGTSLILLTTAMFAAIPTAMAEILGAAIGLNMLFNIPIITGAILSTIVVTAMIFSHSYKKIERWMIAFVSLIGISFLYELYLCKIHWDSVFVGCTVPTLPKGALPILLSVLGAVVMPHNLYLHSEIIQSRQWGGTEESAKKRHIRLEFFDTLFAMILGWAINSAMIVVAASIFYENHIPVNGLEQATGILKPLTGAAASNIFGFALVCAGIASAVTAAFSGGSVVAGMFHESFDIKDLHSKVGVIITLFGALGIIFFLTDTFKALIWSQIILSFQLPWTIIALLTLTSSKKVMGSFVNSFYLNILNWLIALIIIALNIMMLYQIFPR